MFITNGIYYILADVSIKHKMNPLDKIVSQSVKEVLEEDLGNRTYKKVEKELDEMFDISILEAASDFSKLDIVLRKLFGKHSTKLEMKIFNRIIIVEKKEKDESSITIKDPFIATKIFESYGNPVKKSILKVLQKHPKSIPEAIDEIKLPQASTYRRAKELIQDGLLTMVGYTQASDGRKVNEYTTTLNRVIFDFQEKGLHVNVRLQNKFLKDSFVYNSLVET